MEQKLDLILKELQNLNQRVTSIESNISIMDSKFSTMDSKISTMESKMATKDDIEQINKKLNTITSKVAYNSEQEAQLKEILQKVTDHDTDIRLLKQMITHQ